MESEHEDGLEVVPLHSKDDVTWVCGTPTRPEPGDAPRTIRLGISASPPNVVISSEPNGTSR